MIVGVGEKVQFHSAKPIWPVNMEREKNLTVGFRTVFEYPSSGKAVLRIAASTRYRVHLNGTFIAHGPARGPHGYYRLDEWDLTGKLSEGRNLIAIEVTGYNVNSFYTLDQPSFLQTEMVSDGEVILSTAGDGHQFEVGLLSERMRKVGRYSFMRTFIEAYRLNPGYNEWRKCCLSYFDTVQCKVLDEKKLIPRRIPCEEFLKREPASVLSIGSFVTRMKTNPIWKHCEVGPKLGGYKTEELEVNPVLEIQETLNNRIKKIDKAYHADILQFTKQQFSILDFGINISGFIGLNVICKTNVRLILTFDEILTNADVDFKRLDCANIVYYEMSKGTYGLETIEPYTFKYLKLMVLDGDCEISNIYLREYVNPGVYAAHFASSDMNVNRVFEAGRETFRQNAVDIFMDCPSRERAGYLCDSFFTSRVAFDLLGNTVIEKNFFENYLLPDKFNYLPEGMIPMCYPADSLFGSMGPHPIYAEFIPNWAL